MVTWPTIMAVVAAVAPTLEILLATKKVIKTPSAPPNSEHQGAYPKANRSPSPRRKTNRSSADTTAPVS